MRRYVLAVLFLLAFASLAVAGPSKKYQGTVDDGATAWSNPRIHNDIAQTTMVVHEISGASIGSFTTDAFSAAESGIVFVAASVNDGSTLPSLSVTWTSRPASANTFTVYQGGGSSGMGYTGFWIATYSGAFSSATLDVTSSVTNGCMVVVVAVLAGSIGSYNQGSSASWPGTPNQFTFTPNSDGAWPFMVTAGGLLPQGGLVTGHGVRIARATYGPTECSVLYTVDRRAISTTLGYSDNGNARGAYAVVNP